MTDLRLPREATPVEEADARIAEGLLPHAEHTVVAAVGELSDFSDQEPLYAAAAAVVGTGALMCDLKTFRLGTRILAAHLLATALRGLLKQAVDRTRPDVAAQAGRRYELKKGERFESDYNSFPSGHTAGAVAVARAIGRDFPMATMPALVTAGAASAAQVLRSRHFVSDVVAGAAIGILAEAAIDSVIRAAEKV